MHEHSGIVEVIKLKNKLKWKQVYHLRVYICFNINLRVDKAPKKGTNVIIKYFRDHSNQTFFADAFGCGDGKQLILATIQ